MEQNNTTGNLKASAYLQEIVLQREMMGERAINLAGQLAEAKEKIAQLEAELAVARGKAAVGPRESVGDGQAPSV